VPSDADFRDALQLASAGLIQQTITEGLAAKPKLLAASRKGLIDKTG